MKTHVYTHTSCKPFTFSKDHKFPIFLEIIFGFLLFLLLNSYLLKSLNAIICIVVILWSRFSSLWKYVGLSKMNWKGLVVTSECKARKETRVSTWFSDSWDSYFWDAASMLWGSSGHVQVLKQTAQRKAKPAASVNHQTGESRGLHWHCMIAAARETLMEDRTAELSPQ